MTYRRVSLASVQRRLHGAAGTWLVLGLLVVSLTLALIARRYSKLLQRPHSPAQQATQPSANSAR